MASNNENKPKSIVAQLLTSMTAGGTARITSVCILHPFDVLKTRLQYQRSYNPEIVSYQSWLTAIPQIAKQEGWRTFYKGIGVRLAYIFPSAAFNFTIFEQCRSAFKKREDNWKIPLTIGLGFATRCILTLSRTPFDVVKQELQIDGTHKVKQKKSLLSIVSLIKNERGSVGFFTGMPITIARDIVFSSSYFLSYELIRILQTNGDYNQNIKYALAGGFAGFFSTIISLPLDVLKTRIQTQAHLPVEERYSTYSQAVRDMMSKEGKAVFMRGLEPRILSTILSSSITFLVYENIKSIMDGNRS
jgi:hypothetical protein